jgi:predicted ATP-binding protein involved in virulence
MDDDTTHSPLKVSAVTKERVRLGAAVDGITQGDFVGKAVDEFIERHKDELKDGMKKAGETLGILIKTD